MVYDENATLEIPPSGSNETLLWGQALPVRPIESTPDFIAYATPLPSPGSSDLLVQEGCRLNESGNIACPQESIMPPFS